jgi:hypothetical protein
MGSLNLFPEPMLLITIMQRCFEREEEEEGDREERA